MRPQQNLITTLLPGGAPFIVRPGNDFNPYDKNGNVLLTNNYVDVNRNGGSGSVRARVGMSGTDKKYFEFMCVSGTYDQRFGIANISASLSTAIGIDVNGWAIANDAGDYYHNGFIGFASTTWPAITNDVFGFAYDAGAQTLLVTRNNVALTPNPLFTGITGTVYPIIYMQNNTAVIRGKFVSPDFTYTPPSGFTGF